MRSAIVLLIERRPASYYVPAFQQVLICSALIAASALCLEFTFDHTGSVPSGNLNSYFPPRQAWLTQPGHACWLSKRQHTISISNDYRYFYNTFLWIRVLNPTPKTWILTPSRISLFLLYWTDCWYSYMACESGCWTFQSKRSIIVTGFMHSLCSLSCTHCCSSYDFRSYREYISMLFRCNSTQGVWSSNLNETYMQITV